VTYLWSQRTHRSLHKFQPPSICQFPKFYLCRHLPFIIVKKLSVAENQVVANDKRLRRQSKSPTPVFFSPLSSYFPLMAKTPPGNKSFAEPLSVSKWQKRVKGSRHGIYGNSIASCRFPATRQIPPPFRCSSCCVVV